MSWTRPQHPIVLKNLTYLYLDIQLSIEEQLEPILKASPNLKYLAFGDAFIWNTSTIDLQKLTSWCPKLIYMEVNAGWLSKHRVPWIHHINDTCNKDSEGLRCFNGSVTFRYGPDEIGRHLISNATTLEYIALRKDLYENKDWSNILKEIHAPQLHTLVCIDLVYSSSALEMMLGRCCFLESITLRGPKQKVPLDLQKVLMCSKYLKLVHLGFFEVHYGNVIQVFKSLATHHSKLCDMELQEVNVTDQVLLSLTYLTPLKRLSLRFEDNFTYYTDEGLLSFAENLFERSSVDTLELWKIRSLPYPVFQRLVTLPRLKCLSILSYRPVTVLDGPSLVQLLNDEKTCIEKIAFMTLSLTGTDDPVVEFLNEKLQRYKVTENTTKVDIDTPHRILIRKKVM